MKKNWWFPVNSFCENKKKKNYKARSNFQIRTSEFESVYLKLSATTTAIYSQVSFSVFVYQNLVATAPTITTMYSYTNKLRLLISSFLICICLFQISNNNNSSSNNTNSNSNNNSGQPPTLNFKLLSLYLFI